MVKFDCDALQYLSKVDFRILSACEQGMKNHAWVPTNLLLAIAGAQFSTNKLMKALSNVHGHKLVVHDNKRYDGYKLTFLGYDFLALRALMARGVLQSVGSQIGVGKESDIYEAVLQTGERAVLKIHRLGRVCFRAIKEKRDYHEHRNGANWLYLSRLAATREYAYMEELARRGYPVPVAYEANRHVILMERLDAIPLHFRHEIEDVQAVYERLIALILELAQWGLIHCDFCEFNLMINDNDEITVIDFPQMISMSHEQALDHFKRDITCVRMFFEKKYRLDTSEDMPAEELFYRVQAMMSEERADTSIKASGYLNGEVSEEEDLESQDCYLSRDEGELEPEEGAARPTRQTKKTDTKEIDLEYVKRKLRRQREKQAKRGVRAKRAGKVKRTQDKQTLKFATQ